MLDDNKRGSVAFGVGVWEKRPFPPPKTTRHNNIYFPSEKEEVGGENGRLPDDNKRGSVAFGVGLWEERPFSPQNPHVSSIRILGEKEGDGGENGRLPDEATKLLESQILLPLLSA